MSPQQSSVDLLSNIEGNFYIDRVRKYVKWELSVCQSTEKQRSVVDTLVDQLGMLRKEAWKLVYEIVREYRG